MGLEEEAGSLEPSVGHVTTWLLTSSPRKCVYILENMIK